MLMDGRAQASGIKRPAMDATALLVLNAHHDVVKFMLPEVVGGSVWRCLLDTNDPDDNTHHSFNTGSEYEITGRSLVLFVLEPESKRSVALRRAIEAFRQMAERPIPVATPETGPELSALSPYRRCLRTDGRHDSGWARAPGGSPGARVADCALQQLYVQCWNKLASEQSYQTKIASVTDSLTIGCSWIKTFFHF